MEGARWCLAKWEYDREHGIPAHSLSLQLCSVGVHAEQMRIFAQGDTALDDLPSLLQVAAAMRFPTISERWIESRHALVHQNLRGAPHASACHVAYTGIQPTLRKILKESPSFLQTLAAHCKVVRNPWQALRATGLVHHPVVAEMIKMDAGRVTNISRGYRQQVVQVIYHADAQTLFQDLGHVSLLPPGDDDDDQGPGGVAMSPF